MQTPKLSNAQWAFTKDPEGFRNRMQQRAETLWYEGYTVEAADTLGAFLVNTPKGEQHTVNLLEQTCSCPYQTKAEVPQVPCKHLQGFGSPEEGLLHEQLGYYRRAAQQHELAGRTEKAGERWKQYNTLLTAYTDARDEALCRQHDSEEGEHCFMDACAIDSELRGNYGVEF